MKRVGEILHFTKSRLFVVETSFKVLPSTPLCDDKGRKIAVSVDLIGPTQKPFVIAKPTVESPEKLEGKILYLRKQRHRVRAKKRRRL
jgi:rRNA processing protein Gar1